MIFKNLSIKVKMMLIIQLVSLSSLLIGFSYVVYSNIGDFKEDMKNNTIINATLVGDYCAVPLVFDVSESATETLGKLQNIPSLEVGIVYNDKHEVFAEYYKNGNKIPVSNTFVKGSWNKFEDDHLSVSKPIFSDEEFAGTIYLRVSTEELTMKINDYLVKMAILLVCLLLVNYILATWLQKVFQNLY